MNKFILIIFILTINLSALAENIVLTSIQPLYSISSFITKGTPVKTQCVFGSDTAMETSKEALNEENFPNDILKKADAVIDIARVWPDDFLYAKARTNNIHVIEIDTSYPFDKNNSTLFFINNKNGGVNPYIWLSPKNLIKMAAIIEKDLSKIYPKYKKNFEDNLNDFSNKVIKLETEGQKKFLEAENSDVILLSENIKYFLNDFNIFYEEYNPKEVTIDNVEKIMDDTGIKIFVSDRWLKKDVIKAIKEKGGKYIVFNTLNIPVDLNGNMDPKAIFKSFNENINNLAEALKTKGEN